MTGPLDDADAAAAGRAGDTPFAAHRRQLTFGLVLTITLMAFESLAVATVMPSVKADLGGLWLYGWVFSGFFLASLFGIVAAGQIADRHGVVVPFLSALISFGVGLLVGGLAGSMAVLVVGRLLQGLGAGAIQALAYVAIGRGYPAAVRPRMFALISLAWVIPGLVGPAVASLVEHAFGWRPVFLGLLPLVVVAGLLAVPALATVPGPEPIDDPEGRATRDRRHLRLVTLLVFGAGAVLAAASGTAAAVQALLVGVGLPVAAWAFVGLVPPGTVRLAPGVPVTVAVRGLLTCALFSADAYVPLTVVDGRGAATWVGGAALSAAALTWATGAWLQSRWVHASGPRLLDRVGFGLVFTGSALMLTVALGSPVAVAVLAWSIAGFGMGLAYAPLSATVLAEALPGEEGNASASLQLSDMLGIALGTGIGGRIVAAADHAGWSIAHGTALVFVFSMVVAAGGLLAAGRLPLRLPEDRVAA